MSEFKFGGIDGVDRAEPLDKQKNTVEMVREEQSFDIEEKESLMIPTGLKSSVGHPVSSCEEVVKGAVKDKTPIYEEDARGIKRQETPCNQQEDMGKHTLILEGLRHAVEAKVQRTTFEGVKGSVVKEHPDQLNNDGNQTKFAGKQTQDPVISIGDYSTTNDRYTSQSIKKVLPTAPRPNEQQETCPEALSSLSFEDELVVNGTPNEDATPENNTSKTESNDTEHEQLLRPTKRKNIEDESEREIPSGKKAKTENCAIDYPICYESIISFIESQMPFSIRHMLEIPFKVSYKLELRDQSDMPRFVNNFMQNCAAQNPETADVFFHSSKNNNSIEDQDVSANKAEAEIHEEGLGNDNCNQPGKDDDCLHQSKIKHDQENGTVNALGCEVLDISSDESGEQEDSETAYTTTRNENINLIRGERKRRFEMTTEDEKILDLSCKEKRSKKNRKVSSQEFLHPEVNLTSRGKRPKSGKQHIKRTQRKKTQGTPICRKAVPPEIDKSTEIGRSSSTPIFRTCLLPEIDKSAEIGQNSSTLVNRRDTLPLTSDYSNEPLLNDNIKRLGSLVSHALDGMERPPNNMPNLEYINPEVLEKTDDEEKPNHKETKLRLKNVLASRSKTETEEDVQECQTSVLGVIEIKTEIPDSSYSISAQEIVFPDRSLLAAREDDQQPSVCNDNVVEDDTDEERTLLYGFDGPFGRIVKDENCDD